MSKVSILGSFGSLVNTVRCVCLASSKGYLNRLNNYMGSTYKYNSFKFRFELNDDLLVSLVDVDGHVDPILFDGNKSIKVTPVSSKYGSPLDERLSIIDKKSGKSLLTLDGIGRVLTDEA